MVQVHVALVRAGHEARVRHAVLLAGLLGWMAYTRVFWFAHSMHATLPPCPFFTITGHPCPFCGGTRSFAYMWQGRVDRAAALYPLGPLLFAGTLLAVVALSVAVAARWDIELRLPAGVQRAVFAVALAALAVSWTLKLTVLPN